MPEKNSAGINGKIKVGHVGLRTINYEATIQWYIEKLGFRLLKKWVAGELKLAYLAPANDDNFWLEVLSSESVEFNQNDQQQVAVGFQHICFEVECVDETLKALREKDVKVVREPFNVAAIGKRCGFVVDLHGNMIEFAENIA